eukprot:1157538-Pelagomonas_calceolata.AAC.4
MVYPRMPDCSTQHQQTKKGCCSSSSSFAPGILRLIHSSSSLCPLFEAFDALLPMLRMSFVSLPDVAFVRSLPERVVGQTCVWSSRPNASRK